MGWGVWSVECELWSVKCGVECEVWSVMCEVCIFQVWGVK